MSERFLRSFGFVMAFVVGVLPAFFVVFNAVFSDFFQLADRLMTFVLVIISYIILGALFGFFLPSSPRSLSLWLALPAILILAWYSARETGQILLHLLYVFLVVGSTISGVYLGTWLRLRRGGDVQRS